MIQPSKRPLDDPAPPAQPAPVRRFYVALTPGTRLGPYELTAQIGAGGMGEVYRARDTRLQRDVAIKVLPDTFATDLRIVRRNCDASSHLRRQKSLSDLVGRRAACRVPIGS